MVVNVFKLYDHAFVLFVFLTLAEQTCTFGVFCSIWEFIIIKMVLCSSDLFPTTLSFVVFISYMGLFINQGKWNKITPCLNHANKLYILRVLLLVKLKEFKKYIVALRAFTS